jgi:hypothetical protein
VCEPRAAVNRRTASQSPLVRRPLLPTLKEQGRRTLRGLLSDPLGLAAQNPGARDQNNPFPFQPLNRVTDTRHVAPPWSSRRENDEVTQAPIHAPTKGSMASYPNQIIIAPDGVVVLISGRVWTVHILCGAATALRRLDGHDTTQLPI